ncbi:MAG: sensor histidine kinase, partial [Candidatus Dormibacteraceae bacterium]
FNIRVRKKRFWSAFAFAFLAYVSFLVWDWSGGGPRPPAGVLFSHILVAFLFYFAFTWLAPLPWQWTKRSGGPGQAWRGTLQALAFSELYAIGLVALENLIFRFINYRLHPFDVFVFQACFQGPALFLVGYMLTQQEQTESEKSQMRAQVSAAQARHLRGQLHPHVLFNALNCLAELVHDDTDVAEFHIRAMAGLLRRILDASEVDTHLLLEERELVEDYLHLELMRLGGRMTVSWDWPVQMDQVSVPPLLLQPLVENAVKHGLSPLRAGGRLHIAAAWDRSILSLVVRNTGRPLPSQGAFSESGIGIRNLRKRLDLAYNGTASFQLHRDDDLTEAEIRLDPQRLDANYAQTSNHRR